MGGDKNIFIFLHERSILNGVLFLTFSIEQVLILLTVVIAVFPGCQVKAWIRCETPLQMDCFAFNDNQKVE